MGLPMALGLAAYDRPTGSALLALANDLADGTLPAGLGAVHLAGVGVGFGIGAVLLTHDRPQHPRHRTRPAPAPGPAHPGRPRTTRPRPARWCWTIRAPPRTACPG